MLILQKGRQVADKLFLFYRESFEKLLRKDIKYKLVLPPVIKDEPMWWNFNIFEELLF